MKGHNTRDKDKKPTAITWGLNEKGEREDGTVDFFWSLDEKWGERLRVVRQGSRVKEITFDL